MPGIEQVVRWVARPLARRRSLKLALQWLAKTYPLVLLSLGLNLLVAACETASMMLFAVAIHMTMATGPADSFEVPKAFQSVAGWLGNLGSREQIGIALLCVALAGQLVRSGLQFAGELVAVRLCIKVMTTIRRRLYQAFLGFDFEQFGRFKLGELNSYLEQAAEIVHLVRHMTSLLMHCSMALASLAVLFWLSWPMTLLTLLLMAILMWPLRLLVARVKRAGREMREKRVRLSATTLEFLQGYRLVHTFGLRQHAHDQLNQAVEGIAQAWRKAGLWQSMVRPLFETCIYLVWLCIFLVGYLGGQNSAIVASLIAYSLVLYRMVPRINQINNHLPPILTLWPAWQKLSAYLADVLNSRPAPARLAIPAKITAVRFCDVSFAYQGAVQPAVRDLALTIPVGQMTAIVGPSGAGKSTLLNLLLGFYRPQQGQILLDEVDLADVNADAWRRRLGVVDQQGFLFHASVADNIRCGKLTASDAELRQAAEVAGAHEFISQLPQGYDTVIGDRGHRLSGGQRQRLMIARAIVRHPQFLIFDEATSSLDSESERLIQDAIERLRGERTILCIAHRLSTVTAADQILVLDQGALIESGTHAELLQREGIYARLWRLQVGGDAPDCQDRAA